MAAERERKKEKRRPKTQLNLSTINLLHTTTWPLEGLVWSQMLEVQAPLEKIVPASLMNGGNSVNVASVTVTVIV